MSLSGLLKYLAPFIMIILSASFSPAADFLSSPPAHPSNNADRSNQGRLQGMNTTCSAGYYVQFTGANSAFESTGPSESPPCDCFDDALAVTLRKKGDLITWSLAPSLSKYSLNPIDDIKNLQVLFRYRF